MEATLRKNKKVLMVGGAVAALGLAAWMYQSKWHHEKKFLDGKCDSLQTPEDRAIATVSGQSQMTAASLMAVRSDPKPMSQPYGCNAFEQSCVKGDVGGCESMRQSCESADNSVRMSMARPGECDQFRAQCEAGEYASCDMFNRACLYENN